LSIMNIWEDWGPKSNHPAPRRGQNRQTYRSPKSNTNMKGKSGGGGGKPPSKGCGGKGPRTFALVLLLASVTQFGVIIQSFT
jgi:hypothetical protein